MIIVFDPKYQNAITNIKFDPVPEGTVEHLRAIGVSFIEYDGRMTPTDIMTDMFVDGDGTLQPKMKPSVETGTTILADASDSFVVAGLPKDVSVLIDGEKHVLPDGVLEFSTDNPGRYRIQINDPRMAAVDVEIIAK